MSPTRIQTPVPGSLLPVTLALLLPVSCCLADTVRVTSWNLRCAAGASSGGANDLFINDAARTLRKVDPEILLLQGVRDWQMCARLAEALKPADYHVVVCSSFREARSGSLSTQQVAILARHRAYVSWSEAWRSPMETGVRGGFAFAALQLPRQRVGVFSIQFEDQAPATLASSRPAAAADGSLQQLLGQVDAIRRWQMNQVQAVLMAGTFDSGPAELAAARAYTLSVLDAAGFPDAFLLSPPADKITRALRAGQPAAAADGFFVDATGFATRPQILPTAFSDHYPVTCDLELEPAKVALFYREQADQALAAARGAVATSPLARSSTALVVSWWLAAALVGSLTLLAGVWIVARRRAPVPASAGLLPAGAEGDRKLLSSYTVVIAPSSVTGSAAESAPAGATQTRAVAWEQRALAAEAQAQRAQSLLRQGLLPSLRQWLRQKLTRKLIADRAGMLQTQQAATHRAKIVDQRLARIELQIQQQNRAYGRRIEELSCELMAAKEENREMIRARIAQLRAEMEAARAALLAEAAAEGEPAEPG